MADGRNVMVVGDADGFINVGGALRQVAPWTGRVNLDNAANTENAFPEYYIVTVAGGNSARISIRDSARQRHAARLRHQRRRPRHAQRPGQRAPAAPGS